jgi:aspartyl-tRNA(Asn)/glutamyl-tRNA(Gln) amidotransferase subunit A
MDALDERVGSETDRVLTSLSRAGASLTDRAIPHAADIATVYLHLQLPEASAYHAAAVERQPGAYTPAVRLRLEMGRYVLAEDYVRAQRGAEVLQRELNAAMDGLDALVLPALPIVAPRLGTDSVDLAAGLLPLRGLMLRLTQLFDVTGHPAVTLPTANASPEALPVGFQVVGRRGGTEELLDVAEAVERLLRG